MNRSSPISRRAFDIDGLGDKQIDLFFERGWVKEPADIFTLEARNGKQFKLEEIEGYGETSVRNLLGAIRARREISLERFIYALGIRHVGETTAVALARGYGSWEAFHDACLKVVAGDEETKAEMDALDQIGETVIEAIADFFGETHNRKRVDRLVEQVTIAEAEKPKTDTAVALASSRVMRSSAPVNTTVLPATALLDFGFSASTIVTCRVSRSTMPRLCSSPK